MKLCLKLKRVSPFSGHFKTAHVPSLCIIQVIKVIKTVVLF